MMETPQRQCGLAWELQVPIDDTTFDAALPDVVVEPFATALPALLAVQTALAVPSHTEVTVLRGSNG